MPRISSVGTMVGRLSGVELIASSIIVRTHAKAALCTARAPCTTPQIRVLLLHQLRLYLRREFGREIDVARQVGIALDGMGLARGRVLERRCWEMRGCRLLAARGQRDGPVDRETCVIVLGRHRVQLERRV